MYNNARSTILIYKTEGPGPQYPKHSEGTTMGPEVLFSQVHENSQKESENEVTNTSNNVVKGMHLIT